MKELVRQVAMKLKGQVDGNIIYYLHDFSKIELVESQPVGAGYNYNKLTAVVYSKASINEIFNSLSKPTTRLILNTILQVYKLDFRKYKYHEIEFKEKAGSFDAGMIDGSSYHEEFGRWPKLISPPADNTTTDDFDEQDYIELTKSVLLTQINRIKYYKEESVILDDEDLSLMPDEFWTLDHIQHLIIENCTVGNFFKEIGKLHKLQSLKIKESEVTIFPEGIILLQDLEHLEISNALLEAIPDGIGSLKKLKLLDVSGNSLTSFPETIGELVHLEQISANGNSINSLPDAFRNLQTLSILELSSNDFHEFPEVISDLPSLTVLHLNHNRIVSVPASISNLKNLQELFLDNNQLASVPFSLSLLKKVYLKLDENPFTDMPEVKGKNQLELYSYLDEQRNPKPHVTHWDVPESFRVAFQQYLDFFSDFVYLLHGEKFFFETQKIATGLQLLTKPTEKLPIERINELLEAYVSQEKEFMSSKKKFELEYELKLHRLQSDLNFAESQLQQRLQHEITEAKFYAKFIDAKDKEIESLNLRIRYFENTLVPALLQLQLKTVGNHELQIGMHYDRQIHDDVSKLKELVIQMAEAVRSDLNLARAQKEEIIIAVAEFQEELISKGEVGETTSKTLLDKVKSVKEVAITSSSFIKLWEEIQKLI